MIRNNKNKTTMCGTPEVCRQILDTLGEIIDIYGNEIVIEGDHPMLVIRVCGDIHIHGNCRCCSIREKNIN